MRNYNQGKIYKIVCNITGLTYYGSTCEPRLSRRLAKHRSNYNNYFNGGTSRYVTSYKVLENGDCDIILIENYPCNSNDELTSRERYYIENNECVNKIIPSRTVQEWYEAKKEIIAKKRKTYWINNKDKLMEKGKIYKIKNKVELTKKRKAYWINNRDKLMEIGKIYRDKNREKLLIKDKKYRDKNREKIAEYKKNNTNVYVVVLLD